MPRLPKCLFFALLVSVAALRSVASHAAALECDISADGKEVLTSAPPAKPQVNEGTLFAVRPGKLLIKKAIRGMTLPMEVKGLAQFGWTCINNDDRWMGERRPGTKAIQANGLNSDRFAHRVYLRRQFLLDKNNITND